MQVIYVVDSGLAAVRDCTPAGVVEGIASASAGWVAGAATASGAAGATGAGAGAGAGGGGIVTPWAANT